MLKVKLTRMVSLLAAGVAVCSCLDIKKKIKYLITKKGTLYNINPMKELKEN
jgi:hypothetical protein